MKNCNILLLLRIYLLFDSISEKFVSVTQKLVEKYLADNAKIAKDKLHKHATQTKESDVEESNTDIGDSFLNLAT